MHPADQAKRHGRREIGGQQKRISHRQRPVAFVDLFAIPQRSKGELLPLLLGKELDKGHVAHLVQADQDPVIQNAVGQAAIHERAGTLDDVEIGQGIAVVGDEDSRAAPLAPGSEDGHHRGLHLLHHRDALLLLLENAVLGTNGQPDCQHKAAAEHDPGGAKSQGRHGFSFSAGFCTRHIFPIH